VTKTKIPVELVTVRADLYTTAKKSSVSRRKPYTRPVRRIFFPNKYLLFCSPIHFFQTLFSPLSIMSGKRKRQQELAQSKKVQTAVKDEDGVKRCFWAQGSALERSYHDDEWGNPVMGDDRLLFEFLVLEGMQAGMSWSIVLQKRAAFKKAFANFDIDKVAKFSASDEARLLGDAGIIRNKAKIRASILNAKAVQDIQKEFGSFSKYLWGFVGGKPIVHSAADHKSSPCGFLTTIKEAEALSTDLKERGCKFVGPTIMYAFMQAVGMVNDHLNCFRQVDASAAAVKAE
jgi:DNA-3-methyladenine glycosylase I